MAGYYDPRTQRLAVVRQRAGAGPLDDVTLAHELTHALEDQRFGLDEADGEGDDDSATARLALTEGTAA